MSRDHPCRTLSVMPRQYLKPKRNTASDAGTVKRPTDIFQMCGGTTYGVHLEACGRRAVLSSAPTQPVHHTPSRLSRMSNCDVFSVLLVLLLFVAPNARAFLPPTLHVSAARHCYPAVRMAASGVTKPSSAADKLRDILSGPDIAIMPCCYDG